MSAWCLSFHAAYTCEHSGACCTAGWPIAIEPDTAPALRALGGRRPSRAGRSPLVVRPGGTRLAVADGACVFFDLEGGRLCAIQRDAGEHLMPVACRNFPRVALRDPRGVFITLSHYCPTAANLLLTAGDIRIVPAPSSISLDGAVEGLDATGVLPPLLRPGMLLDYDGYRAWERQSIGVLNDAYSPRRALAIIADATGDAAMWQPGHQCLEGRMVDAFDRAREVGEARGEDDRGPLDRPVKAFLAAHLFASWSAYQGGGLSAVVDSVQHALRLLGRSAVEPASFIETVRNADLQLRHLEHVSSRSLSSLRHD